MKNTCAVMGTDAGEIATKQPSSAILKPSVPNKQASSWRDVLTDIREDGRVPWDWIVDETRSVDCYTGSRTIKQGVLDILLGGAAP